MAQRMDPRQRLILTGIVAAGMAIVVGLVAGLLDFAAYQSVALSGMAIVHAVLALAVGALLAALFGRTGLWGWITAVVGGAVVTILVSLIAPFLGPTPEIGAVQAAATHSFSPPAMSSARPLAVPMALIASPFLGLLWLSLVSAVHAAAGGARQV